jgi:hypothetical protein
MARITELERVTFDRRSVHDPVASCLYDFYDIDGRRFLQVIRMEGRGARPQKSRARSFRSTRTVLADSRQRLKRPSHG